MPEGKQWHRDLLIQMSVGKPIRKPIISEDLKVVLAEYLAFRHYYRHAYSFFLKWDELEKLIVPMFEVWNDLKTELEPLIKQ